VVEMQVVLAAASHALALVALPHCEFDLRGDDTVVLEILWSIPELGIGIVGEFEPELEDLTAAARLVPCVDKLENAVERPDVGLDLFVDVDGLSLLAAVSMPLGRSRELPVLVDAPMRRVLRLVDRLRVWGTFCPWLVMAFVDQYAPAILDAVRVRCALA
jgi:hypothetical protein